MNKITEEQFIEEQFVPHDIALKFNDLGFDSFCFGYFSNGNFKGVDRWDKKIGGLHLISRKDIKNLTDEIILAPLYQQAFEFFRTKFGFNVEIDYWDLGSIESEGVSFNGWYSVIHKDNQKNVIYVGSVLDNSPTYREAEIKTINKIFELINNKQNESNS